MFGGQFSVDVFISFINFVARLLKKYKTLCTVYSTFPQESTAQQHLNGHTSTRLSNFVI